MTDSNQALELTSGLKVQVGISFYEIDMLAIGRKVSDTAKESFTTQMDQNMRENGLKI